MTENERRFVDLIVNYEQRVMEAVSTLRLTLMFPRNLMQRQER